MDNPALGKLMGKFTFRVRRKKDELNANVHRAIAI
jgi:hypothetical protein